jgi:hypothetical protein
MKRSMNPILLACQFALPSYDLTKLGSLIDIASDLKLFVGAVVG